MDHKYNFDVIVIGAGPAGSTAAYLLASKGFRVLILDKNTFPRDKLCGGLLTCKTVKLLESTFRITVDVLKSKQIITCSSIKYRVVSSTGSSFTSQLEYPFHFVQRTVYDSFWLKMACRAGAQFRSGEKVISLDHFNFGGAVSTGRGSKFYGKFILGADGAISKVRRWLASRNFIHTGLKSNLATALEIFLPTRQTPDLPDYPQIYFGHIPWGYAWCFPGKHVRVIGICGLNAKAGRLLRNGYEAFLDSIHISREHLPAPASHALPYGNYLRTPGSGNVLLLGDACGLADPLLGEGIYYAHKSAQLAAEAVMQSYHEPPAVLKAYTRHLNRVIIAELKYARIGRQIIFSLPGAWPYRVLTSLLKFIPKQCEAVIQGQRSFKWFRPLK
ncbi:MAG: geranylgeranyl reductase family protein [Desulfobacterales bacterium]